MISALYQLTPSGTLTIGRVDFDEPSAAGPSAGSCTSDATAPGLRIGVRLQVRKPGDNASRTILEMGTLWPGGGCLLSYATATDVASSDLSVVWAETPRMAPKTGVAYAIRRPDDGSGWQFRENGNQRGAEQLSADWSDVEWVRVFAESAAANDGSVVNQALVKLRYAESFGSVVPWPAGWPATLVAAAAAAIGETSDEATAKALFTVNTGAAFDDTTPAPGEDDPPAAETPDTVEPASFAVPDPPPSEWETRADVTAEDDDLADRYPDSAPDAPATEG